MPYIKGWYVDPVYTEIVCLPSPKGYGYILNKITGEPVTNIIPDLCVSDP